MCIRDRSTSAANASHAAGVCANCPAYVSVPCQRVAAVNVACLLYTSDAADERSSVDLGGRRIIKNKHAKKNEDAGRRMMTYSTVQYHGDRE